MSNQITDIVIETTLANFEMALDAKDALLAEAIIKEAGRIGYKSLEEHMAQTYQNSVCSICLWGERRCAECLGSNEVEED